MIFVISFGVSKKKRKVEGDCKETEKEKMFPIKSIKKCLYCC